MQRISITNPQNIIDGTAKKYYFKLRNTGGPKGDKGDKGDTGATGPQGPQGNAATVSVGSTTTLPVGYDATVTNSGSLYHAVLNFGIPQGPQGPQGATGAKGDKGDKGDQGNTGPTGPAGQNATVYIGTTTTLNPGTQATVYNSGTDSNAVLNFGIPKGEKGDTGPMPTIAQTTGQAIDQVMSQKATTDALNTKQATITNSNKLSADLVTDTTTTNKFVTAEDKTTWNAKQNALTAGQGIDITSDVISTPALVPEVVASLPADGTEGKLYLTPKAHTTQTATGNPITASVTEQAGAIESFQLDGDTFQQTYTGKNLFNVNATPTSNTLNEKGITYTINEDGSISTSGTNTSSYAYIRYDFELPAGTYTVSGCPSGGSAEGYSITVAYTESGAQKQKQDLGSGVTFTLAATTTVRLYPVRIGANTVSVTGKTFYPMLEASSTATSYEPYVGRQASPNPDYPQTIQTVTGEQTVTVVGKNLFDKDMTLSEYYVDDSGNMVRTDTAAYINQEYTATPGTTYAFSYSSRTNEAYVRFAEYNTNGVFTKRTLVQNNQATVTLRSDTAKVLFSVNAKRSGQYQEYFNDLQIEINSSATSYTSYSKQTCPINLGKNLFDGVTAHQLILSDGTISDNGNWDLGGYIKVDPNTAYTVSFRLGTGGSHSVLVSEFSSSKSFIVRGGSQSITPYTFTTSSTTEYIRLNYNNTNNDTDFQLEAGSQATTYATYKTPIELCKIGTSQDYIYKDGENWKIHKTTSKYTFVGTEQWSSGGAGNHCCYTTAITDYATSDNVPYSQYFGGVSNVNGAATMGGKPDNSIAFIDQSATVRFYVRTTKFENDALALKAWLSTHNTDVYYALATATDTTITDATLIAQLEAIRTASLENGTNTITNTATGSNLAGDMGIGFYGFAPRNRYDKWLWLDINNEYEQIGN